MCTKINWDSREAEMDDKRIFFFIRMTVAKSPIQPHTHPNHSDRSWAIPNKWFQSNDDYGNNNWLVQKLQVAGRDALCRY